jgi:uncharacterized repeat protein (TIGR01451 family)
LSYSLIQAGTVLRNVTVLIAVVTLVSHAQIDVHINSGDPVYPFPQFQPYVNSSGTLNNLATNNTCGVPHAEMEKTIREAYQIQMNRAKKTGESLNGIDYIKYSSNPDCSEGDGYGILGPAAMADKTTFDGMWLWIHDYTMKKVRRYNDGEISNPSFEYSQLVDWLNNRESTEGSATDGDVDIALALLCAYRQWGEFMGIDDALGNPISYKQAAIDFLCAMTDTLVFKQSGTTLVSGDIGLDGYIKGGDKGTPLTNWDRNLAQTGFTKIQEPSGPSEVHIDYAAPAYFHQFADFLAAEDSVKYAWNVFQFRRATASSDWLMGQLYNANPMNIPYAGWVALSGSNQATFSQFNEGEDFRCAWRTILNACWHGDLDYSWDPQTHQITPGVVSTSEREFGLRFAKFLWDTRQSPWNNGCVTGANDLYPYWGPSVLWTNWDIDGTNGRFFFQNWIHGVGSPSAVISQDFQLMSEMYRQLEIEFNVDDGGDDGYLDAIPFYYHGWFRLLGLLVLSGNYPAPSDIKPTANMKVYLDIDKSFAFEKDTLTYTIDWRNYGSLDATGVMVVDTLHPDFVFVSATGGVYDNTSHTVNWNVGPVKGFKSATGISPTRGQAELKVVISNATQKQYRNKVSISCTNGTGWTSNDYPNNVTAVMERNHLDIARRALLCDYTASKTLVKPGETVEFTIDFTNTSEAGWINGGRSGVNFSFSQGSEGEIATMNTMRARVFNDAEEAYIDFGNYRISYFLYNETDTCIAGTTGCTNGWAFQQTITEGIDRNNVKLVHESIIPGQDEKGKWNQRLIVQFSDPMDPNRVENLTTIDHHLAEYRGMRIRIHRGGVDPCRLVWFFNSTSWQPVNWGEAWSWDPNTKDDDAGIYFPVTNDWTDPDRPDIPVNHWNRKACATATKTVDNILVEEWDGYTWRRVAGNGPMPGREVTNVVLRDTIPDGFSFVNIAEVTFNGTDQLPSQPTVIGNRIISWSIPKMQISEKGSIKFIVKADGTCPGAADVQTVNRAWVSADKESPFADSSDIAISCDTMIKPPPPDHIDIIIDTLVIDSTSDADFIRITLDEGTKTAVAYAVVRDKNGKFIRRATGVQWVCRDITVANAQAISATDWQGLITKIGTGSSIILVSEPGNPGLKPDSLAVTAVATPPWPVIATAVMYDGNADIIPDLLTVTLNDTFHVNQQLDSVYVEYRGVTYPFAATAIQLLQTTFSLSFPTNTTVDPTPSGQVTMVITVDGVKKRIVKNFTDGVGPALSRVKLARDITGTYDTLRLTFTEEVSMATLVGANLQLVRPLTGDTILLTVVAYQGADVFVETDAIVTSLSGIRPQEGELLRLVPAVAGGTVADRKSNLPHLLNRAVMIPARPAQLTGGRYVDENADGIVEAVYLQFLKPVQISDLSVTLTWGMARLDNLQGLAITYGAADQMTVRVALPDTFITKTGIKTDGAMFAKVQFLSDVNEVRTSAVADSAAPVLVDAVFEMGAPDQSGNRVNLLYAIFSEAVRLGSNPYPLLFIPKNGSGIYNLSLSKTWLLADSSVFNVLSVEGDGYPAAGDSVYINPASAVGDSLAWQTCPLNRRVALRVKRTQSWNVQVQPNPLDPDVPLYDTCAAVVRIVNAANANAPLVIDKARISIFDKVGNVVVKSSPFHTDARGVVFYWNGTNSRGRKVGSGTYIGVVTVEDEGSEGAEKVRIGVVRKSHSGN